MILSRQGHEQENSYIVNYITRESAMLSYYVKAILIFYL